ncbi:hypothetical protein R1sor_013237 [Riccia sorocarpa]|uniref:Omega-hydroxypalmitate O-feruloyl transferase n=1 Tax=Riccia sorocarpa TaxID=122646 RepID=A0ABD3H5Y7_9MARC
MGADEVLVAAPNDVSSFAAKVATMAITDVAKVSDTADKLKVTVEKVEYVLPAEPKEPQVYFLTNLDQNTALLVKTLYVFEAREGRTEDPAQVLKTSLAKILNHYWPLAGRLTLSPEMKLIIDYNNEGACFAEATAHAELKDLGDISRPSEQHAQLLYTVPGSSNVLDTPCMVAQVTKFKCGGWTLGLSLQHSIFDGIGANEFIKLWGETARGVPLSLTPHIDRSVLKARSPPKVEFPHEEFAEIENLSKGEGVDTSEDIVYRYFTFGPEQIDALKKRAVEGDGHEVQSCSTFQVLSALIWRARTRALQLVPEQKTRLYFAVNGREKFVPPLPEGYVGNGIVLTFCMTTSADLVDRPLSHSVKLIQDSIKMIDDRYMRSAIDYFELTRARPALTASVIITTWSRLPFQASDFGWGEPVQTGPVTLPDKEVVLFLANGKEKNSISVLMGLPSKVMERFEESLQV